MSGIGALRKIQARFWTVFIFGNSVFPHSIVPTRTSTLQLFTCHVVDFLNARPYLGYETETLIMARDMRCSSLLREANHNTFRTIPQEHWSIGMSMARPR